MITIIIGKFSNVEQQIKSPFLTIIIEKSCKPNMDLDSLLVAVVVILLISMWLRSKDRKKNLPPGPMGLPIIGYIPFMTRKPYIKLTELSKTYGPVYRVKLGSITLIMITDFKLLKEAFSKDAFFGRPRDLPFELSEETIKSDAFFGIPWKLMRRFSLHQLRDLGIGKTRMEGHIKDEIEEIVERLKEFGDTPIRMSDILAPSMSNNIASFLFGNRLKHNDPKRQQLDKMIATVGQLAGATSWTLSFPWLRAFLRRFRIGNTGRLADAFNAVRDFCREEISEHEKTLDPNHVRDYVDGFLLELKKNEHDPNTLYKKDILNDLSRAFFGAGSETVRITVDWVILVAAAFPEVQKIMQKEIDEILGRDGFVSWEDRHRMPYTEAAIMETMRWKTIVPLNLMRSTLADTELNGYFIPKDSRILAVLWAVDHDESLWGKDVDQFKPERFLSEDRKKVVRPDHFIPFSIGKRSCPGKALAEVEVFLYVVTLLQKFSFSLPHGRDANLEGQLGIGLQPKRQELLLKSRN